MADLRLPRINKVTLCGRITHDIDMKYTPKGTPVVRFALAVDRAYKDDTGNWQNATSFIDVVAWSKWAESVSNSAHKGSAVIVEGRIEARSYVDSNGNNRKAVEVIAEYIQFLEYRGKGDDHSSSSNDVPLPEEQGMDAQVTNDDVPF